MTEINFTDTNNSGGAILQEPRKYDKLPTEGYAITIPQFPEQGTITTKVYFDGISIVCDNYPDTITPEVPPAFVDAAYDQLNRLWIAYEEDGEGKLYWYDPVPAAFVTLNFGAIRSLALFMDDIRYFRNALSANRVLLFYIRDNTLYYRTQTERFTVEYTLQNVAPEEYILSAGMNNLWRLQIAIGGSTLGDIPVDQEQTYYTVEIDGAQVMIDQALIVQEFEYGYHSPTL